MNTKNIKPGSIFKNYKALCEVLEIPVKVGTNSKKAQMKELETVCKFKKSGHSFIIEEIYDEQLKKVDNRRSNNSVYREIVEYLISDHLAQSKGSVCLSRNRLMKEIGMINGNYSVCGEHVNQLSKYLDDMDEKLIYDFYNINSGNFRGIIDSALDSLMDKRVLRYSTVRKVSLLDEYFNRVATVEENTLIDDCEKEILKELGYLSMYKIRQSRDWGKFKSKVKTLLNQNSNINHYYNAYDIRVSDKYIEEERDRLLELLLEEATRMEYKVELNETIISRIKEKAQARHDKENKSWGLAKNKKSELRSKETYIGDFEILTKWLIRKDARNIIEEVKNIKLDVLPQDLIDDIEQAMLFG